MRIISGQYGGRVIKAPNAKSIHPMSERIRGAIFNKLHGQIEGRLVLDCFAGSGALGIEALSRGATKVYFVEKSAQAVAIIKQNLAELKVPTENYQIIPTTVLNWLATEPDIKFDLIFADPPYHKLQNQAVLALGNVLATDGQLILSNPKNVADLEFSQLQLIDSRTYAEAKINFYRF